MLIVKPAITEQSVFVVWDMLEIHTTFVKNVRSPLAHFSKSAFFEVIISNACYFVSYSWLQK